MSEGPGRLGEVGQGVETRTWGGQGLKHRQGQWGWAGKLGCGVVDRVHDGRELGSLKQAFKGSGSKWDSWLVAGTGVLKNGSRKSQSRAAKRWRHPNWRKSCAEVMGQQSCKSPPREGGEIGRLVVSNPRKNNRLGHVGNCIRVVSWKAEGPWSNPASSGSGGVWQSDQEQESPRLSPSAMPAQTKAHGMEMQGVNSVKDTVNHSAQKILEDAKLIGSGLIYL